MNDYHLILSLHQLLEANNTVSICWVDRNSFQIRDIAQFNLLLSNNFPEIRGYREFKNRLLLLGFQASSGETFSHPNFVRGNTDSLVMIHRIDAIQAEESELNIDDAMHVIELQQREV